MKKSTRSLLEEHTTFWNQYDLVGWFFVGKHMAFPIFSEREVKKK